jgi:predicted Zn-dependent peptidase
MKKYPAGIAHFLEHKMFEQESGIDPFAFFAESGTMANAGTNYDYTTYLFSGTKEFNKNLKYLLSYVNSPYLTDENVEKEKGIIIEEIKMYDDIPDYFLDIKTMECLYHEHPKRIDIAGTIDSVTKTTTKDLLDCYNTFYHPNNMFILLVGNFDKDEALKIIKEKLGDIPPENKINRKKYKEPKEVKQENLTVHRDINVSKARIAFKFSKSDLGHYDDVVLDMYLSLFVTAIFGSSSLFKENAREKQLLNNFGYYFETTDDYKCLYIFMDSSNINELIDLVLKEFEDINILTEDIERIKKVWISEQAKAFDFIEPTASRIFHDYIMYNKIIDNREKLIRKLNKKDLYNIIKKMDFNNKCIVKMLPDTKK